MLKKAATSRKVGRYITFDFISICLFMNQAIMHSNVHSLEPVQTGFKPRQ